MVEWVGGYYGTSFQGARGVTQGYPPSPTIFNMVVYAVVRHWLMVVIASAEEWSKRGKEGGHQAALFYTDDGMVASSVPRCLQVDFNTLVVLFDRLGLRTNAGKTIGEKLFRSTLKSFSLCKVVAAILNCRLTASITLH